MWMVTTMLTTVSNGMFCLDTSILHGVLVGSVPLLFVTLVISWNLGGMYRVEIENNLFWNPKLQSTNPLESLSKWQLHSIIQFCKVIIFIQNLFVQNCIYWWWATSLLLLEPLILVFWKILKSKNLWFWVSGDIFKIKEPVVLGLQKLSD